MNRPNNVIIILKRENRPARYLELTFSDEEVEVKINVLSNWLLKKVALQKGFNLNQNGTNESPIQGADLQENRNPSDDSSDV